MPCIEITDDGCLLRLRVQPSASRNAIQSIHDDALKVQVTSPPESGKANAAVIKLLAKSWKLPKSAFEITSGHTSRAKTVRVACDHDTFGRIESAIKALA